MKKLLTGLLTAGVATAIAATGSYIVNLMLSSTLDGNHL